MAKPFQNKVVLVTGGASGIGYGNALQLSSTAYLTFSDAQQLSKWPP
jgi:NAD(P)-dependent dehydrogenase (short-subunit alcohol dehydrogenase family)